VRAQYGRGQGIMQVAAAVVGSAAAAQVVNGAALRPATDEERAVLDAAREYYRTGGENHDELMSAVQDLERAVVSEAVRTSKACFCGTGREHVHGEGYHCGRVAP
jgi:hypothetical protein